MRRAALVAFVWCVAVGATLLLAPTGTTSTLTVSASADPTPVVVTARQSLLDSEGPSVAAVLAVPVIVSLGGWLAARRSWRGGVALAATLLVSGVVIGALSIGVFYVPAAVAMVVGAAWR